MIIDIVNGQTQIDSCDLPLVTGERWRLSMYGYAVLPLYSKGKQTSISLHRLITKCPKSFEVDHINGDRLDNRRENLRICTRAQNSYNSKVRAVSGLKGVRVWKRKWLARITTKGKQKNLGLFETPLQAARAYDEAAKKLFGEFAKLNGL